MSTDKKGGSFRNRYLITATLEALAPFHIGTGNRVSRTDSNGTSVEMSTVITDVSHKPYIPGSSLRGAMRQWSKEMYGDSAAWNNLFGSQYAEGKLEVWDASCISESVTPTNAQLSGWDQQRLTYVAKSVAINPETGTAEEGKLYNFELVPIGTRFDVTFSAQNLSEEEAGLLAATINGFVDPVAPMVLGSMTKRGFGQFRIDEIKVYRLGKENLNDWKKHVEDKEAAGYDTLKNDSFKSTLPEYKGKPTEKLTNRLNETWEMTLETPMVVRSGGKFGWRNATLPNTQKASKVRNLNMQFRWGQDKGDLEEIGDLNFSIKLVEQEARPYYHIPSAGIRGAMREWAITNLLPREQWDMEKHLKKDLPVGEKVPKMMEEIISLFGFAVSTPDKDRTKECSRAGRLIINVEPFTETTKMPEMHGTWDEQAGNNYGPDNARRHVKPRNPLDRITHAAKDGGLHNFLEFSTGQKVKVDISVKNPTDFDRRLLEVMKQEINDGMIRFGGLSGIGRGRVKVVSKIEEGTQHGA